MTDERGADVVDELERIIADLRRTAAELERVTSAERRRLEGDRG